VVVGGGGSGWRRATREDGKGGGQRERENKRLYIMQTMRFLARAKPIALLHVDPEGTNTHSFMIMRYFV
jgi:hypothetical protein